LPVRRRARKFDRKSPSNSRLHGRLEALEDVVEVEEEPLEAHEVRETPLEHEKLVKVAGKLPEEVE
jgi:hypothetical protein